MILLDTHAIVWLHAGKRRTRALQRWFGRLRVSPVSELEIQMLVEVGRLELKRGVGVAELLDDQRFSVDDVPSGALFSYASAVGFTRDPFDRLLVGHARARGWRLATADSHVLEHLGDAEALEL